MCLSSSHGFGITITKLRLSTIPYHLNCRLDLDGGLEEHSEKHEVEQGTQVMGL